MTDSNFQCEACDIILNSIDQYMQHTSGRKHLNKVQTASEGGESVSNKDPEGETTADSSRKVVLTSAELPSSLPPIDLPPPPPPPPPAGTKRKAEEMIDGCEICQVRYNSPNQREVHLNGKKHQKKLKTMTVVDPSSTDPLGLTVESTSNLGSCDLCHVDYSSVTIRDQHLNGAKHRKKVQQSQSAEEEMCTLCNVKYTSPSTKLLHIQGRKHLRNLQSNSNPETAPVKAATCFRCMFCNISVNSLDQMEIHRQGNKHKAILQKMKQQQQGCVIDNHSVIVSTENIEN